MMLGTIRVELNNLGDAAQLFHRALELDPAVIDKSHESIPLSKLVARTFLRTNRADEALALLRPMSDLATDAEAVWLMSRAYLQQKNKTQALAALQQSGTYRTDNPMEPEPGPYVGEARCEACHSKSLSGFPRQPAFSDILPRCPARPASSPRKAIGGPRRSRGHSQYQQA